MTVLDKLKRMWCDFAHHEKHLIKSGRFERTCAVCSVTRREVAAPDKEFRNV